MTIRKRTLEHYLERALIQTHNLNDTPNYKLGVETALRAVAIRFDIKIQTPPLALVPEPLMKLTPPTDTTDWKLQLEDIETHSK